MKSIKISNLIKVILSLLCLIVIATQIYSAKSMIQASDSFNDMRGLAQNIRELRKLTGFLSEVRGGINYLYNDDTATHAQIDKQLIDINDALKNARIQLNNFSQVKDYNEQGAKFSDDIVKKFNVLDSNYSANINSLRAYNIHGFDNDVAERDLNQAINSYTQFTSDIDKLLMERFASDIHGFWIISTLFLGLSIIISWLSYIIIKRNVFNRLQVASTMLHKIGSGELFHDFDTGARNEIGLMLEELMKMKISLSGIINSVRDTSEGIRTDALEIDSGNQNLASRTEEQASALQETAASMEEIKTTVANNAENARQANTLSHQARIAANNGSEVMNNVVATMDKISQSARKISEINGVIDGIANQTNILALNAAVEAARAGEQGRGFSVVASEVRSLAARSADAAKEISKLINESVKNVDDGAKLIEDAGKTMKEIVTSVTHVSNIMQEITQASEEQSTGVAQISTAVNEMDLATQQNASMVEESSVITQNMNQNAIKLFDTVSIFRLDSQSSAQENNPKEYQHSRKLINSIRTTKSSLSKDTGPKKLTTIIEDAWKEF